MQEFQEPNELTEEDVASLAVTYGAGWCNCIMQAIQHITPKMLADYCVKMKFPPFPKPSKDENGTRYNYKLGTVMVEKEGKQVEAVNVAAFGDFPDFPKATADSMLEAIKKIAIATGVSPDEVAKDIYKECQDKDSLD